MSVDAGGEDKEQSEQRSGTEMSAFEKQLVYIMREITEADINTLAYGGSRINLLVKTFPCLYLIFSQIPICACNDKKIICTF